MAFPYNYIYQYKTHFFKICFKYVKFAKNKKTPKYFGGGSLSLKVISIKLIFSYSSSSLQTEPILKQVFLKYFGISSFVLLPKTWLKTLSNKLKQTKKSNLVPAFGIYDFTDTHSNKTFLVGKLKTILHKKFCCLEV